jgi:hypothetical protein
MDGSKEYDEEINEEDEEDNKADTTHVLSVEAESAWRHS